MDQKKIGSFLKELRKKKNITQEQLAEKLNVSGRTVSRWETGSNMPDLSLLVEIADFYDVDVREIIEGETKSEVMNEELKDVTDKLVNYAGNEKNKLLKWIQKIGFVGVIVTTLAIVLQCIQYQPSLQSAGAVGATFVALIAMVIITLYVTGIMENLVKRKGFIISVKVATIILFVISIWFVFDLLLVFGIGWIDRTIPFQRTVGIENYHKQEILKKYSKDMDSYFMLFPETTDRMLHANFVSNIKTGLFDSDGYFILKSKYTEDIFKQEVNRLQQIRCKLTYEGNTVIKEVKFDESMYNYPAYIASDGYDYVYEYALLDEKNNSIIYVLLSYPDDTELEQFKDYLKREPTEYQLDNKTVLENFTIYAHKFPGMDGWLEYSDQHS